MTELSGPPFKCPIGHCNKSYKSLIWWEKHMSSCHPTEHHSTEHGLNQEVSPSMSIKSMAKKKKTAKIWVPHPRILVEKVDLKLHFFKPVVLLNRLTSPTEGDGTVEDVLRTPVVAKKDICPTNAKLFQKAVTETQAKSNVPSAFPKSCSETKPKSCVASATFSLTKGSDIAQASVAYSVPDTCESTSEVSLPVFDNSSGSMSPQPTPEDDAFLVESL